MTLHPDEVPVTEEQVRRLLLRQAPQWADLPLRLAGHGTDNVMMRLGDELLVRLPRAPGAAEDVAKEQAWLPYLAPHLPVAVPEPVLLGQPDEDHPLPWSVYRWIEGREPSAGTVDDWGRFGRDLADVVEALHAIDLAGARPEGALTWDRAERLSKVRDDGYDALAAVRRLDAREPLGLDLDAAERLWREVGDTPEPEVAPVWLHGDMRRANLLSHAGRLAGVIDFGTLSIGRPAAEHAAVWDLPRPARDAYRARLHLDDDAWTLARGWSLLPSLAGLPYYRETWPEFARLCRDRIEVLTTTVD